MFENLKVRKSLLRSVKILTLIIILWLFYAQISRFTTKDLAELHIERLDYLIYAVLLLLVNWGLEFFKWRWTVFCISAKPLSKKVLISMLAGIATGIVTPNRIGNFIGRMLYFKGGMRGLLILGTLYGNLAQFISTIFFGVIGFFVLGTSILNEYFSKLSIILGVFFSVSSLFIYLLYPFLPIQKVKLFKKYLNLISRFQGIAKKLLLPLLLLSALRYLVFVLQFTLLLIAFGATYSHDLINGLYVMFFITTLIPSFILGKLFVRETVSMLIIGALVPNIAIVITASLTLWLINLGIPSLVGYYFLSRSKLKEYV